MFGQGMLEEMDEGWSHASSPYPALQMGKKTWPKMGAGLKMRFGGEKVPGKRKELGATWMVCRDAARSGIQGARK